MAGRTSTTERTSSRKLDFVYYSGDLMFQRWVGRAGGPFLFAGAGHERFQTKGAPVQALDVTFAAYGGGVLVWLTDQVGLRFELRDLTGLNRSSHPNDLMFSGGLNVALGARPRDTDGDEVPDKRDRDPHTPRGAQVDRFGVPIDDDADGVPNGIDREGNTPRGALIDQWGVAIDSDHDGVPDGLDRCPDTPLGVRVTEQGCPMDGDGDRVPDGPDRCPGTPAGCTVDVTGCPLDGDGDGVCDGLDQCPGTPADAGVDSRGCPVEVTEKVTELIDTGRITTQNIRFETGRSDILPESFAALAVVGLALSSIPDLRIEIGGHCDERGDDVLNQQLSEARAAAVAEYLAANFPAIKRESFTVHGYGRSKPLVPNTTPANMALNRRVEFVVLNAEDLKRLVERRRPLKRGETAPADTTR